MKKLIIPFAFLLLSANLFAQSNEIKAKSEFFAAQEAYDYANYKECVNHLNNTETLLGSTNPRILHLKIKAYCNLKEYSKAYETRKIFFEKATDSNDPKYNDIFKLLAEINKNAADDFVEAGKSYLDQKVYTKAIEEFNKALEIDSDNYTAYFCLGMAYQDSENYKKARESYSIARSKVKSISDENTKNKWINAIEFNKGIAYYYLEKYDFSVISFSNAIKANPNEKNNYYYNALAYAKLNKPSKVIENLEIAISKGFNDFEKLKRILI